MLRGVLDRQQHQLHQRQSFELGLENAVTPSRGGNVSFPRILLTDKHTKLPLYKVPPSIPSSGLPPAIGGRVAPTRSDRWIPPNVLPGKLCQADRFLPQRRHQNFDVSNYLLTKVPLQPESRNEIDVFGQIAELDTSWRKRSIRRLFEGQKLLPRSSQKSVLNIREFSGNNRCRDIERNNENSSSDGRWKVKARQKPLINQQSNLSNNVMSLQSMRSSTRPGLLDWGSTNFIASVVEKHIDIYERNQQSAVMRPVSVINIGIDIRAIKWNYAGTKIAIGTEASEIQVHHFETKKLLWQQICLCIPEVPGFHCAIICVTFTHSDYWLAMGCSGGRISTYNSSSGNMGDTVYAHDDGVLAIAISPNDRYIVSTGIDKAVRVHNWPELVPHLAIGYYAPVQALAWHPWEVDMLCVGGGFEDGSLSLWDIHRQKSLGFRKVDFLSVVKNMTWNKLSGELVVQWHYQQNNSVGAVVPVLSSIDKIVDVINMKPRIMDIAWNPDGTQLALRLKDAIDFQEFFGNETSKWCDENKKTMPKKKKNLSTDWTGNFENYCIR